jgi:hypothetical protein
VCINNTNSILFEKEYNKNLRHRTIINKKKEEMNKLIEANKSSAQVCVSSDKDRGRGATRSRNKPVQRPTNGKR